MMTVVESTHHAHVKNFDLVVPLLPHPLLALSGAALLHCLLTWRNSSVEQHIHTQQNVIVWPTWATKAPNCIMYNTEEIIIPISHIIHKIEYCIACFSKTVAAVTLFLASWCGLWYICYLVWFHMAHNLKNQNKPKVCVYLKTHS